ncbi:uncharacterized protein [Argopecten irradians]|uniref:uncharacterized protein n=1 Tax=Argopecten irradians TaxID=31199 RepID=UPI003716A9F8
MNCFMENFRRNLLQCRQRQYVQIISASCRIALDEKYMLSEGQKVIGTKLRNGGNKHEWNVQDITKHSSALECKSVELVHLAKISKLKYRNSWGQTVSKIYTLRQHGYSIPQVISHHEILSLKHKKLNTILDMIKNEPSSMCRPPVEFYTGDRWLIRYFLHAKNSTADSHKSDTYAWTHSITNRENIVKYFESKGIYFSEEDIAKYDKYNILNRMSYEKFVSLLEHTAEVGEEVVKLDLEKILRFCYSNKIFSRSKSKKHWEFYECLKDHAVDNDVKSLVVKHEKEVVENLEVLKSHGFCLEDIVSCPLVVCHSPEILIVYLESLNERKILTDDKKKILNLIQYYIERNHRFSMQVVKTEFHAFLCYELNVSSE